MLFAVGGCFMQYSALHVHALSCVYMSICDHMLCMLLCVSCDITCSTAVGVV